MEADMVRKLLIVTLFIFNTTLVFNNVSSQELPRLSPKASVMQTIGLTEVKITYSRPAVRNRVIWGGLEPYGKVWRTGANEATTISFQDEVAINGKELAAGTYALFTIPGKKEWTIIFNKESNQWGAFNYDENEDALRVTVTSQFIDASKERLNFSFNNITENTAEVKLCWEKVVVLFNISVDTHKKAIWNMRAAMANLESNDWATALRCATYSMLNDILPEESERWINKSITINENFRNLLAKAEILAKKQDYESAIKYVDKASAAGRANSQTLSKENEFLITKKRAEWFERLKHQSK